MDILAIPTLAGGPVRRDRATTTVGSFALGVFLRAHSNPRNELAGNGPQMPGRFTMSGFEIRGFCQGNWPMALDFVLDSGSTLVITGTTEGALNSIPRFPQRAAVRKLFCNSRPISRRGPRPPSSPSAASRAAVALVYQRVRHPTYAFLGSARASARYSWIRTRRNAFPIPPRICPELAALPVGPRSRSTCLLCFPGIRAYPAGPVSSKTRRASPIEAIPHASDADQAAWRGGVIFDLPAERNDVVVHRAIRHIDAGAPDLLQQMFARQHAPAIANENCQELEFGSVGVVSSLQP